MTAIVPSEVAGRVARTKACLIRPTPADPVSVAFVFPPPLLYRVVEVVGQVELGELSCESLTDAPDSTLLRFAISSTEVRGEDQVVLAESSTAPYSVKGIPAWRVFGTQHIRYVGGNNLSLSNTTDLPSSSCISHIYLTVDPPDAREKLHAVTSRTSAETLAVDAAFEKPFLPAHA